MTDVKALVIALEDDLTEEEAEHLAAAFLLLRGVLSVKAVPADTVNDHIIRERVRKEIFEGLYHVIFPSQTPS